MLQEKSKEGDKSQGKEDIFRMITTFSENAGDLKKILRKNWHTLLSDNVIGNDLPSNPLVTFRKARSLRNELVHSYQTADVPKSAFGPLSGFFPCGKCKACKGSKSVLSYKIPAMVNPKRIRKFLTCTTPYTIYCLICLCGLRYVGSTIHPTKIRILEHMRAITNGNETYPVARHFNKENHRNRDLLSYYCIDHVPVNPRGGDRILRLRRLESRYIIDLQTKIPPRAQ